MHMGVVWCACSGCSLGGGVHVGDPGDPGLLGGVPAGVPGESRVLGGVHRGGASDSGVLGGEARGDPPSWPASSSRGCGVGCSSGSGCGGCRGSGLSHL